jgi:hypothetical protein
MIVNIYILLSQVYCVWQVVKTPTIIPNNRVYYPPIYAWVFQAVSFPQVSPPKRCIQVTLPHPLSPNSYRFDQLNNIGWGYTSLSSAYSFIYSLFTSSLVDLTILNTLFWNILIPCSTVSVSDQVSHPCKITGKITVLCILIFIFLGSKLEDERFCTEW